MNNNIYSVSQVNNYIKLIFEDDVLLNNIYIEGEISNFKAHTSGHLYFTIKDEYSSINAIMYRENALNLNINLENGMSVVCLGYVSSYPKVGQYQLYIKSIEFKGKGDVFLEFENLKEKLKKEGLFDEVYKMEIPSLPKSIGVITSQTGAAIKDILNIAKRRNSNVKIILIPALAQGNDAPKSIVEAINMANEYKRLDIIILARGGGSKEDLYAFNSEEVARAIFYSSIPIVTGIGHEIDFTISDFVSDLRAPTPSAAIEICLPEAKILKGKVYDNFKIINKIIDKKISENKKILNFILHKHYFKNFLYKILDCQIFVENKSDILNKQINSKIKENNFILQSNINKIESLSPINILKKGYVILSNKNNKIIKSKDHIKKGDIIKIRFYDGYKKAKIIE